MHKEDPWENSNSCLESQMIKNLDAMPGDQASSRGKGKVSWFFSRCLGNLGYNLVWWWGWPFKSRVCSATYRLLSTCEGQLGILLEACERNTVPCQGELEAQGPFYLSQGYWDSYQFSRAVSHLLILKHLSPHYSRDIKGMWRLLSKWGRDLGVSLGFPQGTQISLYLVI